jgi:hypothetical protein
MHPSPPSISSLYNPHAQCLVSAVQVSSPVEYVLDLTNLDGSRVIYTKLLPPLLLTGGIPSPFDFRLAYRRADIQKFDYSFWFFVAVVLRIFEARGLFRHLGQFVRGALAELPVADRLAQLCQHQVEFEENDVLLCGREELRVMEVLHHASQVEPLWDLDLVVVVQCFSKHRRINSTVLSRCAAV